MMAQKAWPALKSCKLKMSDNGGFLMNDDRLSELPDEVLLSILSMASFTTKDAARISVLSCRWKNLWRCFPILSFEVPWEEMYRMSEDLTDEMRRQEISKFVGQLNHVVEDYLGSDVDEFKVVFYLDNAFQSHIDKWMAFALAKQVKRLELNFQPHWPRLGSGPYTLALECCVHLGSFKSSLTSLRLDFVEIASEVVECFLLSCPLLENLSIRGSKSLTSIRAPDLLLLRLKNLEVYSCHNLDTIDMFAPELLSFKYDGGVIRLHFRNAFSLAQVSFRTLASVDIAKFAFDSISTYLSQLEYLKLGVCLTSPQLNLGPNQVSALPNLKHLELDCSGFCDSSVLKCTSLIEASPVLQKLTLELRLFNNKSSRKIRKHEGRPLKCLKTLEIFDFVGRTIDLEFLTYVLKNAIALEEIIVDVMRTYSDKPNKRAKRRILRFERKLPTGVKLILK